MGGHTIVVSETASYNVCFHVKLNDNYSIEIYLEKKANGARFDLGDIYDRAVQEELYWFIQELEKEVKIYHLKDASMRGVALLNLKIAELQALVKHMGDSMKNNNEHIAGQIITLAEQIKKRKDWWEPASKQITDKD